MLLDGGQAEGKVGEPWAEALFSGKNTQWQADEEAQSPGQDKHQHNEVCSGWVVRVGDDHGSSHWDST